MDTFIDFAAVFLAVKLFQDDELVVDHVVLF